MTRELFRTRNAIAKKLTKSTNTGAEQMLSFEGLH
jgi:hypothetical protein